MPTRIEGSRIGLMVFPLLRSDWQRASPTAATAPVARARRPLRWEFRPALESLELAFGRLREMIAEAKR